MMDDLITIEDFKIPFKLSSDCIPVKGYTNSIIVDLTRSSYYNIPNDLFNFIIEQEGKSIFQILPIYGDENRQEIMNYFSFLVENEIIFFTKTPDNFPKIDFTKWYYPSEIYQAIIDVKDSISHLDEKLFESLNNLNCKFIEIRFFNTITTPTLKKILDYSELKSILGIDIVLKYTSYDDIELMKNLLIQYPRVNKVHVYSSPIKKQIYKNGKNSMCDIILTKEKITSCHDCGVVNSNYFTININSFTKSINYNSCLYGKVSINHNGEIKNCPSLKNSFGNIKNTTLEEATSKKKFKNFWNITKDNIATCKDCEYRYICIDCRAYLEHPDDTYSKPLKCGYDPYTGKWEDWSKNPLKQNTIISYINTKN